MKIVFFGTPSFSVPFLQALIDDPDTQVVGVVSQGDKPVGRGGEIQASPVKTLALSRAIPVFTPASLKTNSHIHDQLRELSADVFVVVAYGKLIPQSILDIPPHGVVNVHPSLLPRHRGPSPMQFAIAQGDVFTGVTIMLLDAGMDTGPILSFERIDLSAEETYTTLSQKVQVTGSRLLIQTLRRHLHGEIVPLPQDDSKSPATVTRLLDREDGHINWTESMETLERKSRAYIEWPGLWSVWTRSTDEQLRLKLLSIRPSDFTADDHPGTVTIKDSRLFIDCADGTLEILEIQPEGKPKMQAKAFVAGYLDINSAVLK
ncbi:methionyl-tRNA formyltransferase [Candidatus Uhrbacteria bacterium]|nr:methionyl-tRNA formyltransferase [Candidatus Uhrbacteria bacterium]